MTNQCMYELDPFDAHFDPEKHNKYLVRWGSEDPSLVKFKSCPAFWCHSLSSFHGLNHLRRAEVDVRNKEIEILENFVKKINLEKRQQLQVKFTYRRCFLETVIIGNINFLECCCFDWIYFSFDVVNSSSSRDSIQCDVLKSRTSHGPVMTKNI